MFPNGLVSPVPHKISFGFIQAQPIQTGEWSGRGLLGLHTYVPSLEHSVTVKMRKEHVTQHIYAALEGDRRWEAVCVWQWCKVEQFLA